MNKFFKKYKQQNGRKVFVYTKFKLTWLLMAQVKWTSKKQEKIQILSVKTPYTKLKKPVNKLIENQSISFMKKQIIYKTKK